MYRFAVGRHELDDADVKLVSRLAGRAGNEFKLDDLLLGFVTADSFRHRRLEH
jgi:hypothetical protein